MIKGKSDIFICLGRLLFNWFKVDLNFYHRHFVPRLFKSKNKQTKKQDNVKHLINNLE